MHPAKIEVTKYMENLLSLDRVKKNCFTRMLSTSVKWNHWLSIGIILRGNTLKLTENIETDRDWNTPMVVYNQT